MFKLTTDEINTESRILFMINAATKKRNKIVNKKEKVEAELKGLGRPDIYRQSELSSFINTSREKIKEYQEKIIIEENSIKVNIPLLDFSEKESKKYNEEQSKLKKKLYEFNEEISEADKYINDLGDENNE